MVGVYGGTYWWLTSIKVKLSSRLVVLTIESILDGGNCHQDKCCMHKCLLLLLLLFAKSKSTPSHRPKTGVWQYSKTLYLWWLVVIDLDLVEQFLLFLTSSNLMIQEHFWCKKKSWTKKNFQSPNHKFLKSPSTSIKVLLSSKVVFHQPTY